MASGEMAGEFGDDSDDWEDDDHDFTSNLRTTAAHTTDLLACVYKERILPFAIPAIEQVRRLPCVDCHDGVIVVVVVVGRGAQRMASHDWLVKESAVLALGTLANGCWEIMGDNLLNIFPAILALTKVATPCSRCRCVLVHARFVRRTARAGSQAARSCHCVLGDRPLRRLDGVSKRRACDALRACVHVS